MSEQIKPQVKTSMLNLEGSRDKQALFTHYYGNAGLLLYMDGQRNGPDGNESRLSRYGGLEGVAARVDKHFLNRFKDEHKLSDDEHALDLVRRGLENANETVLHLVRTALPDEFVDVFGLRQEVGLFPDQPSDRVIRLAYDAQDDVERFQLIRQQLLGEISADYFARLRASKLYDVLYNHQVYFNKNLFDRSKGVQIRRVDLLHHNATNEVVDPDQYPELVDDSHIKSHIMYVRHIPGVGPTLVQPRIKDPRVVAEKGWVKALKNGGIVNMHMDVTDLGGMMYTVLGGKEQRDALTERLEGLLNNRDDIVKVEPDDNVNEDRGQTQPNWRRLQAHLTGDRGKLEYVVHDLASKVNYSHQLASIDGSSIVRAHQLFEIVRTQTLFPDFFPTNLYEDAYAIADVSGKMQEHEEHIVEQLQNSRVSKYKEQDLMPVAALLR